MKDLKYIYWFAYYNEDSPSVRYRGIFPLEYLKKNHGIDSTLITPSYKPKKLLAFIKTYLAAMFFCKQEELIVIQRVHSNFIYSSLLKLLVVVRKKNSVYDLDDADYLYCKPNSIYFFAKKCKSISAGSNAIYKHLSQFNSNIVITPSPTPDLGIIKQKRNETFTIGWIGGFGGDHKKTLIEIVFPAISELNFNCKFALLGVTKKKDIEFIRKYFNKNEYIQLEIPEEIHWRNEEIIQQKICAFDIGIATLFDNEIQRSKSGIKAKQYLNNGIPVLGTNLPENNWVIKNGINGFFCSNSFEFKQRITQFKSMTDDQYSYFSKNARESIVDFNLEAYFTKIQELYRI